MTYAMTLDNSWEIMNEDEMYDVNGGGWFNNGVSTFWTGIAIDAAIIAAGIGLAASSFLKSIKLAKAGRTYIRTSIQAFVRAAGYSLSLAVWSGISFAIDLIFQLGSVGGLIAAAFDYADGNYNGRIKF